MNAENLKKAEGPRKLYVGNLNNNINEIMLKAVFEPFGQVMALHINTYVHFYDMYMRMHMYSRTCLIRSPMGLYLSGCIRQVTGL